jgi:hypothetical protein
MWFGVGWGGRGGGGAGAPRAAGAEAGEKRAPAGWELIIWVLRFLGGDCPAQSCSGFWIGLRDGFDCFDHGQGANCRTKKAKCRTKRTLIRLVRAISQLAGDSASVHPPGARID